MKTIIRCFIPYMGLFILDEFYLHLPLAHYFVLIGLLFITYFCGFFNNGRP